MVWQYAQAVLLPAEQLDRQKIHHDNAGDDGAELRQDFHKRGVFRGDQAQAVNHRRHRDKLAYRLEPLRKQKGREEGA